MRTLGGRLAHTLLRKSPWWGLLAWVLCQAVVRFPSVGLDCGFLHRSGGVYQVGLLPRLTVETLSTSASGKFRLHRVGTDSSAFSGVFLENNFGRWTFLGVVGSGSYSSSFSSRDDLLFVWTFRELKEDVVVAVFRDSFSGRTISVRAVMPTAESSALGDFSFPLIQSGAWSERGDRVLFIVASSLFRPDRQRWVILGPSVVGGVRVTLPFDLVDISGRHSWALDYQWSMRGRLFSIGDSLLVGMWDNSTVDFVAGSSKTSGGALYFGLFDWDGMRVSESMVSFSQRAACAHVKGSGVRHAQIDPMPLKGQDLRVRCGVAGCAFQFRLPISEFGESGGE